MPLTGIADVFGETSSSANASGKSLRDLDHRTRSWHSGFFPADPAFMWLQRTCQPTSLWQTSPIEIDRSPSPLNTPSESSKQSIHPMASSLKRCEGMLHVPDMILQTSHAWLHVMGPSPRRRGRAQGDLRWSPCACASSPWKVGNSLGSMSFHPLSRLRPQLGCIRLAASRSRSAAKAPQEFAVP